MAFWDDPSNPTNAGDFKQTNHGTVEIKQTSTGMTGLYVNGQLKEQSNDASYIKHQYDNY